MIEPQNEARELALKRLTLREHSARELEVYLERRGFSVEIIESTLALLMKEKLLDDRRYARSLTRSQALHEKGPGYIHQKLQQKGIRIELSEVRSLFNETSDRDEMEMARSLVERRYPRAHEDEAVLRRAYSALLRRGFSGEIARKALLGKVPREAEGAETP